MIIIGIILILLAGFAQDKLFRANERYVQENRPWILQDKMPFYKDGYKQKSNLTVYAFIFGAILILIGCLLPGI